jgi:hypothetical protein
MNRIAWLVALLTLFAVPRALAAPMEHAHAGFAPPALEPLKKLAGTWTGKAGSGDQKMDATVTYKITANGSAVMETLFPDTDHEMVTMYTVDRGALVLTTTARPGISRTCGRGRGVPPTSWTSSSRADPTSTRARTTSCTTPGWYSWTTTTCTASGPTGAGARPARSECST